jgi:hypothetical protein
VQARKTCRGQVKQVQVAEIKRLRGCSWRAAITRRKQARPEAMTHECIPVRCMIFFKLRLDEAAAEVCAAHWSTTLSDRNGCCVVGFTHP